MGHLVGGGRPEDTILYTAFQKLDDAMLWTSYDALLFEYIFELTADEKELRRYSIQLILTQLRRELDRRRITWDRADEVADEARHRL
jgi:hypothetical protein